MAPPLDTSQPRLAAGCRWGPESKSGRSSHAPVPRGRPQTARHRTPGARALRRPANVRRHHRRTAKAIQRRRPRQDPHRHYQFLEQLQKKANRRLLAVVTLLVSLGDTLKHRHAKNLHHQSETRHRGKENVYSAWPLSVAARRTGSCAKPSKNMSSAKRSAHNSGRTRSQPGITIRRLACTSPPPTPTPGWPSSKPVRRPLLPNAAPEVVSS